ncbi:MAG: hypothetical protein COW65_15955 [Cytophagales bacterium CG18_big_fil_WC_8_21_14_2_50_42_9]|nr:MAG: hypothetical protein COW65_15955 [Cytophagales bacterium CG18_big_fil_WC_8_21_14_2_50_42_9]
MKKLFLSIVVALVGVSSHSQGTLPGAAAQIKAAEMAAPSNKRSAATVYGYNQKNELVVLRKGTNEIICLADNPTQKGFSVAAYQRDLEPFMARGRELKKQGKSLQEIFDIRENEVKSGKLAMPKQPATLFVFTAADENYNAQTGEVKAGSLRYVVYTPYATAETTGLPLKPEAPGMPWIMHPGTHGAHIMITPPTSK